MKEIRLVDFEQWCPSCKYVDTCDSTKGEEPCNQCLTDTTNIETCKPTRYEVLV